MQKYISETSYRVIEFEEFYLYVIMCCAWNTVNDKESWIVCFRPHDTPFEDGTFKLTMEFTEEYPNKPPTVRFVSKMFHPNGMHVNLSSYFVY